MAAAGVTPNLDAPATPERILAAVQDVRRRAGSDGTVDHFGTAHAAVKRGERLAMVTVVGAQGSTPRETGARMLVWPERFEGTIGGGSLEYARRWTRRTGC